MNINLTEILDAFSAPLNEEEAWALCYQVVKYLQNQPQTSLLFSYGFNNSVDVVELTTNGFKLARIIPIRSLPQVFEKHSSEGTPSESPKTEAELMCLLGMVVYKAFDYGLASSEEQISSQEFTSLIEMMTGCEQADDEGGQDSPKITFNHIITLCIQHGQPNAECQYNLVLKNLIVKYLELRHYQNLLQSTFIKGEHQIRIASSELRTGKKRLKKTSRNIRNDVPVHLSVFDQLMQQIKEKKWNLKKVQAVEKTLRTTPPETPYEMILQQICVGPGREALRHVETRVPDSVKIMWESQGQVAEDIRRVAHQICASKTDAILKQRMMDKEDTRKEQIPGAS